MRSSLLVDVLQVVFYRELTDAAACGDFLIGEAAEDKPYHTSFTWRERVSMETLAEHRFQQ